MEMPQVLEAVLEQDPDGSQHFHALTLGKQRNLIYLVSQVKNEQSQMKRSLAMMEHLRENRGELNFKMLNELIKRYNQRGI